MSLAIGKAVSLLLLIIVGFFLRKKINSKDQKEGIKTIILSVALPTIIFVGLQKISFTWDMLMFPIFALLINFTAYFLTVLAIRLSKIELKSSYANTLKLLIPSLAPGLSCFPFLLEYFGESALALGAIADIGNKFFVLIVLYLMALRWLTKLSSDAIGKRSDKLKSLLISMINEPVNLVIFIGLGLLMFGINYEGLPVFIQLTVDKLSYLMVPLVLIFIGISVKFDWKQIKQIWAILLLRSGFLFLISGIVLTIANISDPMVQMLIVLFPQSSCSFWPYAHMCLIEKVNPNPEKKVFDIDLGMNILALSLPISTLIILFISTYGTAASNPNFIFTIAALLMLAGVGSMLYKTLFRLAPNRENNLSTAK